MVQRSAISTTLRALVLLAFVAAALGCHMVEPQSRGRSPLLPLAASPENVTLEVFSAPTPLDDANLAALWREVDEQPLSAELRRNLTQNGVRAGIVGPHVSEALAKLLKVTDRQISAEERMLMPLDTDPAVMLRVVQPRPGKRNDLVVSSVHEQIALLRYVDGQVEGKTYQKAEGRFTFRVFPEQDARVRLELLPELQYGELKTHVTGSEAMFVWKPERPKQVFPDLKIVATLGAGQMLVFTALADHPGSIGHHFFVQTDGEKPMQKVWVIRLAQAGADRSFFNLPKDDAEELSSDEPE